jgi:hypothetical protein
VLGIRLDGIDTIVGPFIVLGNSTRNARRLQSRGIQRLASDWRCQSSTTWIPRIQSGPSRFTNFFGSVRTNSLGACSLWRSDSLNGKFGIITDCHELFAFDASVTAAVVLFIRSVFKGVFLLVDTLSRLSFELSDTISASLSKAMKRRGQISNGLMLSDYFLLTRVLDCIVQALNC